MLETTLLDVIEDLKKKYEFSTYQSKMCDEFFTVLNKGDFIYPGHLKSKLNIDIESTYKFMEALKEQGFVQNIYEIYCMQCNKSKGKFLDSLNNFNDSYACDFCNKDLSIVEDIIVLYKVINL